jgi:hypothetical protein
MYTSMADPVGVAIGLLDAPFFQRDLAVEAALMPKITPLGAWE